jgi:hypothetical protein
MRLSYDHRRPVRHRAPVECWTSRVRRRVRPAGRLDVHHRVAMQILRHSKIAVTMEIYTEVPSVATRDALRKLSDWLTRWLLPFAAARRSKRPVPLIGTGR